MLGWVVALYTITIATSLARLPWPGLIWLALIAVSNLSTLFFPNAPDGQFHLGLANTLIHTGVYMAIRLWRDDHQKVGALIAWQIGSIITAILLFTDGTNWTWWNWIVIVTINLFLAEIWPLYWLLIRPFFG